MLLGERPRLHLSPLSLLPRRYLIAANWKMHPIPDGALADDSPYKPQKDIDIFVFPTFLSLGACLEAGIATGAQCGHPEPQGAYTGDVSMAMLRKAGCTHVLCGHSERRLFHGENNESVAAQATAALEAGLHPIICIGESAEERDAGEAELVVTRQLTSLPLGKDITIAYEPVWAIGTGNTATPELAQEMHALIRSLLPAGRRETTRILYGGSMKPENARELLVEPDIDGGLVGGASLKPDAFRGIIAAARSL